jgi:hypothetical protein
MVMHAQANSGIASYHMQALPYVEAGMHGIRAQSAADVVEVCDMPVPPRATTSNCSVSYATLLPYTYRLYA